MSIEVVSLDTPDFWVEVGHIAGDQPELALAGSEAVLLRPDHPFLRAGAWRGFVAARRGRAVARLVASIDPRVTAEGRPAGAIGFIAGVKDAEALSCALRAAQGWLASAGAAVARCPVQLTTWFGHRAIIDGFPGDGGPPPFLMEPSSPRGLIPVLERAGFTPAHRAVSHRVNNAAAIAGCLRGVQRMQASGFRDRPLDVRRWDHELSLLHGLASQIFRKSWGYGDIALAEFAALHRQTASVVDPDLVRIVEAPDGQPAGFVFALPDSGPGPGEADGERAAKQFVLKTIGVLPEVRRACPGLGSALTGIIHELAEAKGYRSGIHALMAEGSYAQRTSARWGSRIRSYATFDRTLRPYKGLAATACSK